MYGTARTINEAVTHDMAKREVCVSLCNYSQETREVELELRSFGDLKAKEYVRMVNPDLDATNGFEHPDTVKPEELDVPNVKDGSLVSLSLAPMSWSFVRFQY